MSGQGSKLWFQKSGLELNFEKLMIGTGINFENFWDWDFFDNPCVGTPVPICPSTHGVPLDKDCNKNLRDGRNLAPRIPGFELAVQKFNESSKNYRILYT